MSKYELPVAKGKLAEEVSGLVDKLAMFISPGIDPAQFLAMVVAEANALSFSLTQEAIEDYRTKVSFVKAAFNAAVVGLLPGPALGHCYFIAFDRNKNKPPVERYTEIVYVPGYKGFLELAFANSFLVQCDPEVVLAGEFVERMHTDDGPKIKHEIPVPRGQIADRKTIIGAYCTYRSARGGRGVVYMDRSEIDLVDKKYNIWQSNYTAMCLKTVIRRAAKRWQITRSMAQAIMLDEAAERDDIQPALVPMDDPSNGVAETIDLEDLAEVAE